MVLVHWIDITGDGAGDVSQAAAMECTTSGFFWGYKKQNGQRMLVLQLTRHTDKTMRGWDIYPVSIVKSVEVLRKVEIDAKLPSKENESGNTESTTTAERTGRQRQLFVSDDSF